MLHSSSRASHRIEMGVALFALALAASAHAQSGFPTPRVDTMVVLDAEDGTSPSRASWRTWLVADPAGTLHASTPPEAFGLIRPGALWAETTRPVEPLAARRDRVVVVEKIEADPNAPGGSSALIAVARTSSAPGLTVLPPTQLARIEAPSAVRVGAEVRVTIEPLLSLGMPVLEEQGLTGWNVLRSPSGLDQFSVVGSVASAPFATGFRDAPPPGNFDYAVQPVFAGEGLQVIGYPGPWATLVGACQEPSAVDRFPGVEPLRVMRDGSGVHVTWQPGGAASFDVMAGHLSTLRAGGRDFMSVACRVGGASASIDMGTNDAVIVVGHCGASISSQGRRSDGIERDLISSACP